jgi:hypothetical protein
MTTTGYEAYESAGELLRALSAPIRVAIVAELGLGESHTRWWTTTSPTSSPTRSAMPGR